jgi:hypothetical protein
MRTQERASTYCCVEAITSTKVENCTIQVKEKIGNRVTTIAIKDNAQR